MSAVRVSASLSGSTTPASASAAVPGGAASRVTTTRGATPSR
jgi:hypothetical protein